MGSLSGVCFHCTPLKAVQQAKRSLRASSGCDASIPGPQLGQLPATGATVQRDVFWQSPAHPVTISQSMSGKLLKVNHIGYVPKT